MKMHTKSLKTILIIINKSNQILSYNSMSWKIYIFVILSSTKLIFKYYYIFRTLLIVTFNIK